MTSEQAEGRAPHPAPTESPAAKPDTRDSSRVGGRGVIAVAEVHVRVQVIAGGFFRKAMSGKVRPAPREPQTTHYGCSCCRWTA
jgi:hypothetical protein